MGCVMPSYTLIILGREDRGVRAVQEVHADTDEAARRQAQLATAQFNGTEAVRFELWCQNQRIAAEPKPPK